MDHSKLDAVLAGARALSARADALEARLDAPKPGLYQLKHYATEKGRLTSRVLHSKAVSSTGGADLKAKLRQWMVEIGLDPDDEDDYGSIDYKTASRTDAEEPAVKVSYAPSNAQKTVWRVTYDGRPLGDSRGGTREQARARALEIVKQEQDRAFEEGRHSNKVFRPY